jgi:hypothetical protein
VISKLFVEDEGNFQDGMVRCMYCMRGEWGMPGAQQGASGRRGGNSGSLDAEVAGRSGMQESQYASRPSSARFRQFRMIDLDAGMRLDKAAVDSTGYRPRRKLSPTWLFGCAASMRGPNSAASRRNEDFG